MSSQQQLIVIGGSAGSLQALFRILEGLQKGFDIPIAVVLHRATQSDSTLSELLKEKTHLKVIEIEEKEKISNGYLYVCPADYHVLIEPDETFSLDVSEKVNYSRPSVDVTFRSAADVFCERLTAILLSGANADGAEGLQYVKQQGGVTIVQQPTDAQVPYMPEQALRLLQPDHVLTGEGIGEYLKQLRVDS